MRIIYLVLMTVALSPIALAGKSEKKLLKAVLSNHAQTVDALLEKGADVNHTLSGGESLLMCASERGFDRVASLLLEHGAQVNHRNRAKDSALIIAAKYGRIRVLQELLNKQAQVNYQNKYGSSAIHYALRRQDFGMTRLLLANGANPDLQNDKGQSSLHLAASFSKDNILKQILPYNPNLNLKDQRGNTPLAYAVLYHRHATAKALLEYGADTTIANESGETPNELVEDWNTELKALFAQGQVPSPEAQPLIPPVTVETFKQIVQDRGLLKPSELAFFAAESGLIENVDYLASQGLDIHAANKEGITPLMIAVVNGRTPLVAALLERGADPNHLTQTGYSALYLAGLRHDKHIAQVLMDAGGYQVGKIFDEIIELPKKKPKFSRLANQIKWMPNLIESSYLNNYGPKAKKEKKVASVNDRNVTPPKFLHQERPVYPQDAKRRGIRGAVVLKAILRKDGTIDDINIIKAIAKGSLGFEDAAIQALKNWRFEPGLVDGKPADVRMTLKISFSLSSGRRIIR